MMMIDETINQKAQIWLTEPFDTETQNTIKNLLENDPQEIVECFYKDLEFGTGGMRGLMGLGTNRINKYTLGLATQGYSNFLNKKYAGRELKVAIAHDSRNNSKRYARKVADIFTANGIKVFLFESLRPTPELSFAVRELGCQGGIVLTASHNPKEYNGYKVYGDDGGQLVPPDDKAVIEEIRKVDFKDINFEGNESMIEMLGADFDQKYLERIKDLSISSEGREDLKVVFTALHGTSGVLLPHALKDWGFDVTIIEEQLTPDGNFPTVVSPNPEEAEALEMAVKKAQEIGADLVIGNDPDSDRVGIAVKNREGTIELLNGNQTAVLLFYYYLSQLKENNQLPENGFIAETIVTTDLIGKIANHFNVPCKKCYTGFKWIAEMIRQTEGKEKFIIGGEESYGYLIGDFVRDKDAISSSLLIAEMSAWAKHNGKTLVDLLEEIYTLLGHYLEKTISLTKPGKSGAEEIAQMMEKLRNNPPNEIGGESVKFLYDYQSQTVKNIQNGTESKLPFDPSNVIQVETESGVKFTARPSGTEPKIKFYISVNQPLKDSLSHSTAQLEEKINLIAEEIKKL